MVNKSRPLFYDERLEEVFGTLRAREFNRYLHPTNFLPAGEHSRDADTDFDDVPNLSQVLAPLCQLTALQCRVKKAMINCMDSNTMYFLTEAMAAKTSVEGEEMHEFIQDPILASCTSAPLEGRICELTIRLADRQDKRPPTFVVPDLSKSQFAHMPIISGPPFYRFYAGMPIRTKTGVNIGSLAIMDDQPREGLSQAEENFMHITVTQIMSFLDTNRQAIDNARTRRMMRGLTNFVSYSKTPQSQQSQPSPADYPELDVLNMYSMTGAVLPKQSKSEPSVQSIARDCALPPKEIVPRPALQRTDTGAEISDASQSPSTNGTNLSNVISEPKRELLQRAAIAIRKSLSQHADVSVMVFKTDNLFASESNSNMLLAVPNSDIQVSTSLTAEFMRALSGIYPKGHIWNLGSDICLVAKESAKDDPYDHGGEPNRSHDFEATIKASFPEATQALFVPIFEANIPHPPFCLFIASHGESYTFDTKTDLPFLYVFCSTISSELSRIEALRLDRQKTDFVGNISHEMRSPLHGILSCSHFLLDSSLTDFQKSMLNTIDHCSETLLDTVNHILDYAKINSFEKQWSKTGQQVFSEQLGMFQNDKTEPQDPHLQRRPSMHLQAVSDISAVVEQVIDHLAVSHIYHPNVETDDLSREASMRPASDQLMTESLISPSTAGYPEIILDIQKADWSFATQPGAMRLIISNLVGNALKYTSKGTIKVAMTQQNSENDTRHTSVVLEVIDTGIGMSQEFLESKLYLPFSQENHLSPGTGLGLSIVHNIVKMMQGEIAVTSSVGEGTKVKVTLPLSRPLARQSPAAVQTAQAARDLAELSLSSHYQQPMSSRPSIRYYGRLATEKHGLRQIIDKYLKDWSQLEGHGSPTTVIIMMISDLRGFSQDSQRYTASSPAVIALYEAEMTHHLKHYSSRVAKSVPTVQFVSLPCGPHKLSRAVRAIIDQRTKKICSPIQQPLHVGPTTHTVSRDSQQLADKQETPVAGFVEREPEVVVDLNRSPNGKPLTTKSIDPGASVGNVSQDGFPYTPLSPGPADEAYNSTAEACDLWRSIPKPPIASETKHARKQATATATPTVSNSSNPSVTTDPRILIVDDNAINLRLLETYLRKRRKYTRLTKAMNGREAVDAFTSAEAVAPASRYDLVFMDISMPVMNGFEATRKIRQFERMKLSQHLGGESHHYTHRRPPLADGSGDHSPRSGAFIIALTGLASDKDQAEGFECGLDLYMTKPVVFDKISRVLDSWERNHSQMSIDKPG